MRSVFKFIVLLFCFSFLDGVKFRCDYRYTYLGWFKYHEIPAKWHDARLECQSEGGILASPTTSAIKSFMLESFCKPEIFTGIHSTFSKGHYYSIDGIPLAQIPHEWAAFEPDNKNNAESCLALNTDGQLSDVRCDEPRPYICYREHSHLDVTVCGTPDPEYHFESRTNKCYKFHTNRQTFERAHFICSAEGGHLAIINSDEESTVIRELFAKYPASTMLGNFWKDGAFIGFHNWGESADWTTIDGQSIKDAGFAKFSPGQPDNATAGEYCGSVLRNGLLNDLWCDKQFAFICEKSPNHPPVCDVSSQNVSNFTPNCNNDFQVLQKQSTDEHNKTEGITGPVYNDVQHYL